MTDGNENQIIAQRYAKALLDLSGKDLTKEQIFSEISDVLSSVNNSDDLKKLISSPAIQISEKKKVLNEIFTKNNNVILNFLNLLIDKNRFTILPEIVRECQTELNRQNKILEMKITSAIELNESEKAMIKVKLEKLLEKNLELKWTTNDDIIGGLIFQIDDRVIDCSILNKLSEIKRKVVK